MTFYQTKYFDENILRNDMFDDRDTSIVRTDRYNTVLLRDFSTASDFTWNQFRWMLKSTKSVILKAENLHFVFRKFVQKYPKIFIHSLCTKTWRITFLVMWRAIMSKSSYYQSIFENDGDRDRGESTVWKFNNFPAI